MMNGDSPDEYELADAPEPDGSDSASSSSSSTPGLPPGSPGRPLPRMWKSDADDEATPPRSTGSTHPSKPSADPTPPTRGSVSDSSRSFQRRTGLKPKPDPSDKDKGEKKVLIEETPVLDTIEARQTARLTTGALFVFIIGLGVYLFYSYVLYDPFPMDALPSEDEYLVEAGPPPLPKSDLEFEARAMFARAREAAKMGRTDDAIALLQQLIQTYKNSRTAAEAQEALERPSRNLPLFLDSPTVVAEAPPPASAVGVSPPLDVVDAQRPTVKVQGEEAELVAPVNPTENLVPPAPDESIVTTPGREAIVEVGARNVANVQVLPAGFQAKDEAGDDPSGWPLVILGDRDGAPMVFIPGGVFVMGYDRDQRFASPEHRVRLSAYYIDQHEVTVGQFRRFLEETQYRGQPETNWRFLSDKDPVADTHPVVMVSQADALAFAEWAGKSLITEAQWEAAARTTDGRIFPWGSEPIEYSRKRTARQVDPVMSFPEDRSPYNVFDLAGNAMEWTADVFDRNYYQSLVGSVAIDPTGPPAPRRGNHDVVVKGGKSGHAFAREPIGPTKRVNYVGFRCALQVERTSTQPDAAPGAELAPAPSREGRPSTKAAPPAPTRPQAVEVEPF